MKKLFAILLTLSMSLTLLAGCGGNNNDAPSSTGEGSGYEDTMPSTEEGGESIDMTDLEEAQPVEQPELKPDPKPETKPETKPEQKPETKPEQKPETKPEEKPETKPEEKPAAKTYTGTMGELITAIYEKQPVELAIGAPAAIDLSNADTLRYNTGLSDASKIKEAYVSEAMIGAQAYSLVAVRANSAADALTVAQDMFDNIDTRKWICVGADTMAVGVYGDVVMLAMVDSNLSATLAADLRTAFASVCGGELDKTLDMAAEAQTDGGEPVGEFASAE